MTHLPVYQHRQEILDALVQHDVIVVESPTGSGKTTQIPLILHEAGYADGGIIGVTQPRRIATLSVCDFMMRQLEDESGYVGYKMRFADTTNQLTRLKIMTDGILLMELKADPLLRKYSVILVDEAHERSLNIDFILGLLKQILKERDDFKVIISSATINTKIFSDFFDHCPVVSISSRVYPVDIFYRPLERASSEEELINSIRSLGEDIVKNGRGDTLIFLHGEAVIKKTMEALSVSPLASQMELYPLYGRLSKEEQERVFTPTGKGKTKFVIATNIAETSVTIDGIKVVIDSGIAKMNYYNQKDFTSSLITLPVSRSSCDQRTGRAGRTSSGTCFRLYSEQDYQLRGDYTVEEILRTDLSEVILRMSELGIYDYDNFPFITKPKSSAIHSGENTLKFIGAIDEKRHLTPTGEKMVAFPLIPRHSRVIIEAMMNHPGVLEEVIIAISFLSTRSPFFLPPGEEDAARDAHKQFANEWGDFVSYLTIFYTIRGLKGPKQKENFCTSHYLDVTIINEIFHIYEQLCEIVSAFGIPIGHGGSKKEYLISLSAGLLQYVLMKGNRYEYHSVTAQKIFIHPGSAWFRDLPQYLLAGEIVYTTKMYARTVSPIRKEWLDEISTGLRARLSEAAVGPGQKSSRKGDSTRKDKQSANTEQDSVSIGGIEFKTIPSKKNRKGIIVIPLDRAQELGRRLSGNSRRGNKMRGALQWRDGYIHLGDSLNEVLAAIPLIDTSKGVLDMPPKGGFSSYDPALLIENLEWILALTRVKGKKNRFFFVHLDTKGHGYYRFESTRSAFDALDTSLYALGQLIDEIPQDSFPVEKKKAEKKFNQLLRLFDAQ
ncbi:MAG: ATP-dependent RNA helicase [Sphaerochaetaceae bacterium]|nr:ATP-dependent RNA helicase [Sphaerochaetaceae bacterium]